MFETRYVIKVQQKLKIHLISLQIFYLVFTHARRYLQVEIHEYETPT